MPNLYKRQPKNTDGRHDFADHQVKDSNSSTKTDADAFLENMTKKELREGYRFLLDTVNELTEEILELAKKLAAKNDIDEAAVVDYENELTKELEEMTEKHGIAATFAYMTNEFGDRRRVDWKISYPTKWAAAVSVITNFCEKHSLKPYEIWVEGD